MTSIKGSKIYEDRAKNKDYRDIQIDKIGKIALDIRKALGISEDIFAITKEMLDDAVESIGKAMAKVFGKPEYENIKGRLQEFNEGTTLLGLTKDGKCDKNGRNFIEKISNEKFVIYYEYEHEGVLPYLTILHELGHVVMHWDKMEVAETVGNRKKRIKNRFYCNDPGFIHSDAQVFARTFAMPEKGFLEVAERAKSDNNVYDPNLFAKTYKIYCSQVNVRGVELNIWR